MKDPGTERAGTRVFSRLTIPFHSLKGSRLMRKNLFAMGLAASALLGLGMVATGDDYTIDTAHSGVVFKISHSDLDWVFGRFNHFSGEFAIDSSDPSKSSFTMKIDPNSVDTNNAKRDGHLKSPDFFNTKQFPNMGFTSTSVKPIEGGFEVTGDFTLHGQTKPVTFNLKGGKTIAAKGGQRTGYTAEFPLKRSEFGITKGSPMLGEDVWVTVSFQGVKK
jgi:polyisoprenoid-binding protein YceI